MKTLTGILVAFILILNFCSCSTGQYTVSANGDKADIKFKNGKSFSGELVSISDSAVYLATIPSEYWNSPVLFYFPVSEIKSMEIEGYDGGSWITPVILLQILPVGLLTGAAASVKGSNAGAVALIFAIPAIVTSICFGTTEEHIPQWNDNLPVEDIRGLNMYSRYPEPLSETEFNVLLKRFNQKAVKKYF